MNFGERLLRRYYNIIILWYRVWLPTREVASLRARFR